MEDKLREIALKLENMTIYEVRQIAREIRAQVTSGQKGSIIDSILSYAKGESEAKPLTSRGAPPKSDKYDEKLVEDIRAARVEYLTENRVGNVLSVADGGVDKERGICGILDYANGDFYLYSEGELCEVSPSFVSRYSLRVGDRVRGKAKRIQTGGVKTLVSVDEINGGHNLKMSARLNFSELTSAYPERRILLSGGGKRSAYALIDLFVPLAFGQRVVLLSPAHGGKTTLIKEIARGVSSNYPDAHIIILQLWAKPEELTDFARAFPSAERFTTDFCAERSENIDVAHLAFERAKRLAEFKKDAVIFADGIVSACGGEAVKKLLGGVHATEEGGTVTAVLSAPTDAGERLVSAASAVITLSEELSSARVYPAIDVKKSYSYRDEKLLSTGCLSAADNIRAKFGAREIIGLANQTPDADKLTEKYKNG